MIDRKWHSPVRAIVGIKKYKIAFYTFKISTPFTWVDHDFILAPNSRAFGNHSLLDRDNREPLGALFPHINFLHHEVGIEITIDLGARSEPCWRAAQVHCPLVLLLIERLCCGNGNQRHKRENQPCEHRETPFRSMKSTGQSAIW